MNSETLAFQPPHPLNQKEQAFVQSLTKAERELHELATTMLGSSYFVGKTHAFKEWVSNLNTQPPKGS